MEDYMAIKAASETETLCMESESWHSRHKNEPGNEENCTKRICVSSVVRKKRRSAIYSGFATMPKRYG